jgi:predicted anti-sigma-YlaC factor YlaD
MQALRQALSSVETAQPTFRWIPTVGQMVMGFILPFALAFVAIPLESFVHSSRTVVGVAMAAVLRLIAFALRLLGNAAHYSGEFLVNIYDLLIFPALWLENLLRNKGQQTEGKDVADIQDIIVNEEVS